MTKKIKRMDISNTELQTDYLIHAKKQKKNKKKRMFIIKKKIICHFLDFTVIVDQKVKTKKQKGI